MKLLNLKDVISNNIQKLDTCDNVIRPISVITIVKPTTIKEPVPAPDEEQMTMIMTTEICGEKQERSWSRGRHILYCTGYTITFGYQSAGQNRNR
jgi:hypothetical protein